MPDSDRGCLSGPSVFLCTDTEAANMIPIQAAFDPTMAVVLLSILLTFVVIFGFIWAFDKIRDPPEDDEHNGNGHGV